jgi:hypothetical protein
LLLLCQHMTHDTKRMHACVRACVRTRLHGGSLEHYMCTTHDTKHKTQNACVHACMRTRLHGGSCCAQQQQQHMTHETHACVHACVRACAHDYMGALAVLTCWGLLLCQQQQHMTHETHACVRACAHARTITWGLLLYLLVGGSCCAQQHSTTQHMTHDTRNTCVRACVRACVHDYMGALAVLTCWGLLLCQQQHMTHETHACVRACVRARLHGGSCCCTWGLLLFYLGALAVHLCTHNT